MFQAAIKYHVPAIKAIVPITSVLLSFVPLWGMLVIIVSQHVNYYYAMKLIE